MLMDNSVAEQMDKEKTTQLLRLLATDLNELADRIDGSIAPDTDENVRGLWDDIAETMESVFSVMASEEQFDEHMEELITKEMEEHPQLSREEAETIVLQHMDGDDRDDDDGDDDDDENEGGDE